MSQQAPIQKLSFTAGVDLSSALYKAVKITGNNVVGSIESINDIPLGIVSEPAGSGKPVSVTLSGTSKVLLAGNVVAGDVLAINATGSIVKYDSTNAPQKIGIALEGGASGSYIEALIRIL